MDRHEELKYFIQQRMRLSHVYQPVMLMALLRNGGSCSDAEIARSILAHDESQVDYYRKVTNTMVGRVLRRHELVRKEGSGYLLNGYEDLSREQVDELVDLCEAKLAEYKGRRGDRIWKHRRASAGYVPGTLRYEVLKRARFRCELCGISADEKALEVDHIVPRVRGGSDEQDNLQALCYSCNATKRDRDSTDFRAISESYAHREPGCPFCAMPAGSLVGESELAYAVRDAYPVTGMHTLVIPKRHVADYFGLGSAELNACNRLLAEAKREIQNSDPTVRGFNVGVNSGEEAGQTVFHSHVHLIPRRKGDVEDPTGGVRGVIPGKGKYA